MRRRDAVGLIGFATAWPLYALAQPMVPRLGVLLVGNEEPFWSEFRAGLRDFNYVNGQNIRGGGIEWTIKDGIPYHVPTLMKEVREMVARARRDTATTAGQ